MDTAAPYEARLQARLEELTKRLKRVERVLDETRDPDPEERSVEREDDEFLEGLGNAGLAEIKAIEAALNRLSEGAFGTCVTCGSEISKARLDLIPHAAQCRNCAT